MERVVTGKIELESPEEGGSILIADTFGGDHLVVRLSSFDPNRKHEALRSLEGKQVRVTIEVLD